MLVLSIILCQSESFVWKHTECTQSSYRPQANTFTKWIDKGITAICTPSDGNVFKSFEKLHKEFKLENKELFCYLQQRHFMTQVKIGLSAECNVLEKMLQEAYKHVPSKIVSKMPTEMQW